MQNELPEGKPDYPVAPDAYHLTIHADGIMTMEPIPPLDPQDASLWGNFQIAATVLSKLDEAVSLDRQ